MHCMGWNPAEVWKDGEIVHTTFKGEFTPTEAGEYAWRYRDLARLKDWQPHLPTEKGKVQAIDLAEKYGLTVNFGGKYVYSRRLDRVFPADNSWQSAVLKACLYSAIGEE